MGIQILDASGNLVSAETAFQNQNQTTGALESKGALIVNTPRNPQIAGFAAMSCVRDKGAVLGYRTVDTVVSTIDGRQETSLVVPCFTDTFTYAAQDTGRWNVALTTYTMAYGTGGVTFNSGNSVAANAVALMKSYWTHIIPTEGSLWFRAQAFLSAAPVANTVVEMGFLYASGTTAPTDGVFFRYDATGVLKGVANFNGSELTTNVLTTPSLGIKHIFEICLHETKVEFWIDGVLQDVIFTTAGGTQPQPMASSSVQVAFRQYNLASAPATTVSLRLVSVDVYATDGFMGKTYQTVRAGMGHMGYQGVTGMTMGSTALNANSGNPTAAVPTNTTAALGTGLGGNFWETASLAVNTDGILCSYLVPAAAVATPGRKLVIYGVFIDSIVQTVLAGGPFVCQYSLAFGHTALSLATAEGAAAKAPRRIVLGFQNWAATAAVGSKGGGIIRTFQSPIVVNPGEYVAICVRNIGTVGTAGTIAHAITFDAHWS